MRLGQRGMRAQLSGGVFAQFINAYRGSEQGLGINDEAVPAAEIASWWTDQSERLGRVGKQCAAARGTPPTPRSPGCSATHRPGRWGRHRPRWSVAASGGPVRSRRCSRGRCTTAGPYFAWSSPVASRSWRPCRSPGSPTSCRFPRGAVRCLRRLAAVRGRDLLPDAADLLRQGQQGRRPPPRPRPGHGRAHPRGGAWTCCSALAEQLEAARLLEHGITKERLAVRLLMASPIGGRAHQGAVPAPRRGCDRALPRHRHRRGQLHRRPVRAAARVTAGGGGAPVVVCAAPAAVHDRRRGADRHGRAR